MICNRCHGTGFLNIEQVPLEILKKYEKTADYLIIRKWLDEMKETTNVKICNCCGNGEDWFVDPGEHYEEDYYPLNEGIPLCV